MIIVIILLLSCDPAMTDSSIILVSGPAGVGKTAWVREYLQQKSGVILYYSPGSGSLPLDGVCLSLEFPTLMLVSDGQEDELWDPISQGIPLIVEIPFYKNPAELQQLLQAYDCTWIGVVPSMEQDLDTYLWADQVVEGLPVSEDLPKPHLWRAPLSGQVLDPASLEVFWFELLGGAYGQIYRAKGIFEMPDGQALWCDYTIHQNDKVAELNYAQHLDGRPNRLSGLEVLGKDLDTKSLSQSLQDCWLSDASLSFYQHQLKHTMAQGELAA